MCVCWGGEMCWGGLSLRLIKWITFPLSLALFCIVSLKEQRPSFQLCVCVLTLLDSLYAVE